MASPSGDAEKTIPDSGMSVQTPRQPRLHVVSFNGTSPSSPRAIHPILLEADPACLGTWAGGVLSSRKTVVSEFVKLISDHENVFEIPLNGVGSDINLVDRVVGGKSYNTGCVPYLSDRL